MNGDIHFRTDTLEFHHSTSMPTPDFIPSHAHNKTELLLLLGGEASYVMEDSRRKLCKNDIVITRPAVFHSIDVECGTLYDRFSILFDHTRIDGIDFSSVFDKINVVNCSEMSIINQNIKKMELYCLRYDEKSFCDLAYMLIKEIFYNLLMSGRDSASGKEYKNPLLSEALQYINTNLNTIADITEISRAIHISTSYLCRIFNRHLKITPKKYITDKRLLEAQNAIRAGGSPTETAAAVGFCEYSTFYRCYLRKFGYAPSEER